MPSILRRSRNNRNDTKQNIISTARALFSESGYLGVSMNDIARKLNITKAALYYHFTNKVEIYNAVLDEVSNDINAALTEAFKEPSLDRQLYKIIKNYLDLGAKEQNIIKATMSSEDPTIQDLVMQNRKQIDSLIQPLLKQILDARQLSEHLDSRLSTSLLICMMDGIILEYSFIGKKIDSDNIAKQWVIFLFQKSMLSEAY